MIEEIKKHLLRNDGKLIAQRININYLKKHNLYNFILDTFDDSYSLIEKIYCLTHDLISRKKCKTCGQELKFKYSYPQFCSRACLNKDPEILEKNKTGVSKSLKLAYKERGDEIKEKRANTLFNKYGTKICTPYGIPKIQEQIKNTILEKYGVTNVFYLEEFRGNGGDKSRNNSISFNKLNGHEIEYLEKGQIKIKNLCKIHGDIEMTCINFYNRVHRNRQGVVCPICCPISSFSSLEIEFENLIKEIGITNYLKNTKKIINPYEVDYFFPDFNIGIELNGVYWHSELHKDKNYHKIKSDLCKDKGIQLIHIWEDDFYNKTKLIKSILSYKFNKNLTNKIYARNCIVKTITSKDYRIFLEQNHLQGIINSSIRYGLFFDNELVSVMGFGKLRSSLGSKNKELIYELQRFCSKQNTVIIGGASKLFSYFLKHNEYKEIISYAKRDYSNGNLYKALGFNLYKICEPGFYWAIDGQRKHRYNYRKDKIVNEENKHLTAVEIMHNLGYVRCFDSGNYKFSFVK